MFREQRQDEIPAKETQKLGRRKFWRVLKLGSTMKIFFVCAVSGV